MKGVSWFQPGKFLGHCRFELSEASKLHTKLARFYTPRLTTVFPGATLVETVVFVKYFAIFLENYLERPFFSLSLALSP